MAQKKFTINLQEASFPLVSSMKGKAVLIPNLDQERELPQLYWMENMIPIARGVRSPSYVQAVASGLLPFTINASAPDVTDLKTVYSLQNNSTYLLQYGTILYLYDSQNATWNQVADVGDVEVRVSIFYLKGRTLIFHPTIGLNELDEFCLNLVSLTVVGINLISIVSMAAAVSYIVCTDGATIYWSSPLNELSFDPIDTGENANAGSTKVLAIKGNVNFLSPSAKGFIAYATGNAAEVIYTGSADNPWRFIPVLNSNGVYLPWHHASEANGSAHFLWSDTGLAAISEAQSQQIFPEVSDFLTGTIYEEYDYLLGELIESVVPDAIAVRIAFVANRYLCISYGPQVGGIMKYILMYDMVLKRWGRLRIDHLAVFSLDLPQRTSAPVADEFDDNVTEEAQDYDATFAAAFLPGSAEENFRAAKFGIFTLDGAVVECNLADNNNKVEGLLLYGEIALTRNRFSDIIEVELAGENEDMSIEGKSEYETRVWSPWIPFIYAPQIDTFQEQISGRRHELKLIGKMFLSTVVINTVAQGTT